MAEEADSTQPESVVQPFADLWSSYMQQPNEAAEKMLESLDGCTDPHAWRQRWLDALSESADAHMRSPAFLQAMKHNLDGMIQAKAQASRRQHAAPDSGAPDLGNLRDLCQRMDKIISRLRDIEGRLQVIEDKLEWPPQAKAAPTDAATK